jgi:hypothetical protein
LQALVADCFFFFFFFFSLIPLIANIVSRLLATSLLLGNTASTSLLHLLFPSFCENLGFVLGPPPPPPLLPPPILLYYTAWRRQSTFTNRAGLTGFAVAAAAARAVL